MFLNSPRTAGHRPVRLGGRDRSQAAVLPEPDRGDAVDRRIDWASWPHSRPSMCQPGDRAVQISPAESVTRRSLIWSGMTAETVQVAAHEPIELRFRAPRHLLVVWEQATRRTGESFVEGLPHSRLRDLRQKLTFIPANREYYESIESRTHIRFMCCYFDPEQIPGSARVLAPRLFFEDSTLWATATKLKQLIESSETENAPYVDALGTVLAHELVRSNAPNDPPRGGLAAWQQRAVTDYIEEHLADPISLATLAALARLSPYYFCRAFKQSFGAPPHRYHISRRIEHAKALLANPASSVTDIGLTLGFSETSSFTAAFHKLTGVTPTTYRRSLL
jgi:AraC family transcriptional regulator